MIYARPLADEANASWEGSAVMSGKRPLVLQDGVPSEAPDTDFVQLADVAVSGNFADLSGSGLTEQTTLVDSDQFVLQEAGGTVKKTLWSTIKADVSGEELPSSVTLTYSDGLIVSLSEVFGADTHTTTYSYTDGILTSAATTIDEVTRTETYTYTGDLLTGITAEET